MAWTDLSAAFGYGTKLTSAQQGQLRDNASLLYAFLASCNLTDHGILLGSGTGAITPSAAMTDGQILVGQSGADPLPKTMSGNGTLSAAGALAIAANAIAQANMADNAIGQAELKDADETETCSTNGNGTMTGHFLFATAGQFGFGVNVKYGTTGGSPSIVLELSYADGWTGITTANQSPLYFSITFDNTFGNTVTVYATRRYITASGDLHWIFYLRAKITKEIIRTHSSPDHPCMGSKDPVKTPHPWIGEYDESKHEIVVVTLPTQKVMSILEAEPDDSDRIFAEIIIDDYAIDELSAPEWPTEPITVGLPRFCTDKDNKKVPVDFRAMSKDIKVTPIKKVIPKPDNVVHKSLKKKQATK
jgi:hypothetical protein